MIRTRFDPRVRGIIIKHRDSTLCMFFLNQINSMTNLCLFFYIFFNTKILIFQYINPVKSFSSRVHIRGYPYLSKCTDPIKGLGAFRKIPIWALDEKLFAGLI